MLTVLAFFHSFLLFFGWRSPTLLDAALLFGTGFINAIGQWFWTKALQMAPAPAVTPFYYLMLVWALVFGFVRLGRRSLGRPSHRIGHCRCHRSVPVPARSPAAAIAHAARRSGVRLREARDVRGEAS